MVFGAWGTCLYKAATGELLHTFVDKAGARVRSCAIDGSGKFLVTAGNPGAAFVKDIRTRENLHELDDTNQTMVGRVLLL
eukprot:COSAG04_NODE_78_length_28355_cov_17.016457_3_plen_80_part_00